MYKLLVISGPTSSGKTSLGLAIAQELGAYIISADSRQIIKHMDIGTGKLPILSTITVTKKNDHWVLNNVPVFGYDLVTPDQHFSAYDYSNYSRSLIRKFSSQGIPGIIVGGTGFYIDTFLGRVTPSSTPPDLTLRSELNLLPLKDLQDKLKQLSSDAYATIDTQNKVRIVRAIEKIMIPPSETKSVQLPENIVLHQIGLKASNEYLYTQADRWAVNVWENGLVSETKILIEMGYENAPAMKGLIYKSVKEFLRGTTTKQATIERIQYDLHAYIRRQLTWFKRTNEITWFDISQTPQNQIKSDILKLFSV